METLALPPSCARLVALVALKRRALHRSWLCATLWPSAKPANAVASLRSTLWRLRPIGADRMLVCDTSRVALAPNVAVDWHTATDLVAKTLHEPPTDPRLVAELLPLLRAGDLLDGWADAW